MKNDAPSQIPGYDYGHVARSPVSLDELRQLETAIGYTDADTSTLAKHRHLFDEQAEAIVDSWRAAIGSQPHLAKWFFGPDGKPDDQYKGRVKRRFVQWVKDVPSRPHDQAWLDYQEEIGQRHTPAKKNVIDGAATPSLVPMRYLVGFVAVVTISTRRFFTEAGVAGEELQQLEDAWARTVLLHVTLWSRAYVKDGLW